MRTVIVTTTLALFLTPLPAADSPDDVKAGLQALNEYVGTWNGVGGPDKPKPDPRDPSWKETITWSWRFKGADTWLNFDIKDGKQLKGGEVRYLPAKKMYQLTSTDAKNQKAVYDGKFVKDYLTFERTDKSGEVQQIVMNTAGDGARFVYRTASKAKGRTVFTKGVQVAANKDGESMAGAGGGAKKPECVVTGGLGTMQVSYMGKSYYVCCSGCKDAFEENPAKFVKEFEMKKGK